MRRIITLPVAILMALLGLWLAGAVAATAAPQAQRCVHNTPLTTHNRVDVEAHLITTCGHYFEAYANWQNVGYKFGAPKRTGYDNVCAHPDCSTSGGALIEAGVKRVSDGTLFCEYSCGSAPPAHTTAVTAQRCTSHYAHSDGYTGVFGNIPFAKAKWKDNTCKIHLEVRVQYTDHQTPPHTQWSGHSGSVVRVGLWSQTQNVPAGDVYDQSQIRFRPEFGNWQAWQKLSDTSPVIRTTALVLPAGGHGAMITRNHRACASGECYAWTYYGGSGRPQGFEAKWTTNTGSWYIRGHSKCVYPGVPPKYVNGGWVHSTGLYSAATCPSPYVINQGAEQWKKTLNGSITTHWEQPV